MGPAEVCGVAGEEPSSGSPRDRDPAAERPCRGGTQSGGRPTLPFSPTPAAMILPPGMGLGGFPRPGSQPLPVFCWGHAMWDGG